MRYRSNLSQPELTGFKLLDPPKQMMGHDAPSDPDFEPGCTYLTHDEGAILLAIVGRARGGRWADIGGRLGWTSAHIASASGWSIPIDPELRLENFSRRFEENISPWWATGIAWVEHVTSEAVFSTAWTTPIRGAMIDGNHDSPEPTLDAQRAIAAGAQVLVWHDFWGQPIQDAVTHVMRRGWKARIYSTPNGMAVAWNDPDFEPPDHVPDPAIDWAQIRSRVSDFNWSACV